jgi:alkyl hydroperoxide reductase subunit AhpC
VAKLKPQCEKRNVKVLALSADPLDSHLKWINDINETQHTTVNYPLIADPEFKVANLYGMVHPNVTHKFTVRLVFVIGTDKKVKLTPIYPAATDRNFDEILRVVEYSIDFRL